MKFIELIAAISIAILAASCTLTPTQQNTAVKIANVAISKLDKNNKITAEERSIIERGVRAATNPKDRTTDALIESASSVLTAAVNRGAVDQKAADDIDAVLALAGLIF